MCVSCNSMLEIQVPPSGAGKSPVSIIPCNSMLEILVAAARLAAPAPLLPACNSMLEILHWFSDVLGFL